MYFLWMVQFVHMLVLKKIKTYKNKIFKKQNKNLCFIVNVV